MKIQVSNFQPYSLVEVEVKGLTVVIGPSNVGKSSFIRAVSSAFYSRQGEYFIRKGQSSTIVKIEDAPTNVPGQRIDIEWHKGKGLNKYVINGETYDKTGVLVPIPILSVGYRDIPIGDEYIRPQVADQWDRIFLLDRAGSFAHDVIAQASRLGTLLKADRDCASDLRSQKRVLNIRKSDLEEAEKSLKEMEPIKEFHSRVQKLKEKVNSLLRLGDRIEDLREMVASRERLLPITTIILPEPVKLPIEDMGSRIVLELRELAHTRASLSVLPPLPNQKPVDLTPVEEMLARIPEMKVLRRDRTDALSGLVSAEAAVREVETEAEMAQADLDTVLASINTCPTCGRPM